MACPCQSSSLCRLHYAIAELKLISGRVPERVALTIDTVIDMLFEELRENASNETDKRTSGTNAQRIDRAQA